MNSVVEAANKNIKKNMSKKVVTYKDWHEMLPFTLYAYCTVIKTSTGFILYSLVYEMKTLILLEAEIPSLKV
jgi:hypothetical protein